MSHPGYLPRLLEAGLARAIKVMPVTWYGLRRDLVRAVGDKTAGLDKGAEVIL